MKWIKYALFFELFLVFFALLYMLLSLGSDAIFFHTPKTIKDKGWVGHLATFYSIIEWALFFPVCLWLTHQAAKRKVFLGLSVKDSVIGSLIQMWSDIRRLFRRAKSEQKE